jgi:hypothetical protein
MKDRSLTSAAIAASIFLAAHSPVATADNQRGDPVLVDLVAAEYTTVEEFLDTLKELKAALLERDDPRVIFVAVYIVQTGQAHSFLEANLFEDPEWAEALTLNFANRFRQAFFDYETENFASLPRAWKIAFETSQQSGVTVFQHALLGIHAHVNHDLSHAIAAVTPQAERAQRAHDYMITNDLVIGGILEAEHIIGAEFAPFLANLDELLGEYDAQLLRVVLTQWRYRAWRTARLFDGSLPTFYESLFSWILDMQTGRLANVIAIGGE